MIFSKPILALLTLCALFAFVGSQQTPILLFSRTTEETSTGSRLRLTKDGAEFLGSLKEPFAIVATVGATRTGKSFVSRATLYDVTQLHTQMLSSLTKLLNQVAKVALNATSGDTSSGLPFPVGGGVTSYTHGLWIWPEPLHLGGITTYLVDSEGLHGVESVQTLAYEVELFVHASMLASAVIYNTWAPVDAEDVRTLKSLAGWWLLSYYG